jgi:hypothetical protein
VLTQANMQPISSSAQLVNIRKPIAPTSSNNETSKKSASAEEPKSITKKEVSFINNNRPNEMGRHLSQSNIHNDIEHIDLEKPLITPQSSAHSTQSTTSPVDSPTHNQQTPPPAYQKVQLNRHETQIILTNKPNS